MAAQGAALCCLLATLTCVAAFSAEARFRAFKAVFPVRDGSEILASDTVFAEEALKHLDLLGAPHNASQVCALDDDTLLLLLMKASLGNLVQEADPAASDKVRQPYQANPVTGRIEYVDNYTSNRVLVLQVLIFSLLLGLARAWFLLEQPRPDAGTEFTRRRA